MQGQPLQSLVSPLKNDLSDQSRPAEVTSGANTSRLSSDVLNATSSDKKGATDVGESSKPKKTTSWPTAFPFHNPSLLFDESKSINTLAAKTAIEQSSPDLFTNIHSEKETSNCGNIKSGKNKVSQPVSARECMHSSNGHVESLHRRRPSLNADYSQGRTNISLEERAARVLATLRAIEPEAQKTSSVSFRQTSDKVGGKVESCTLKEAKNAKTMERESSTHFSSRLLLSECNSSHQTPKGPYGNSSNKKSAPSLSSQKATVTFSHLDSIDRVAMTKEHLSDNSEIKDTVNAVAALVANEVRFGDCWYYDGPIPHLLVVPPSIHHTSKMLKNGSKLIDTRKSSSFCVESSNDHISALNIKETYTTPWCKQQSDIAKTDHAVLDTSSGNTHTGDIKSMMLKSCMALAVERFAADVFYPHLISGKSRISSKSVSNDRIIISTLLALREMMVTNADKFFSSLPQVKVCACAGAIVRSCAKKVALISCKFSFENFMRACESYDSQRGDFRFALVEANSQSLSIFSDGSKPNREESILSRISFNKTMMSHPLVYSEKLVSKYESPSDNTRIDKSYSLTPPSPSLCAAFLIKTEHINSHINDIGNLLYKACDKTVNGNSYNEQISYQEYLRFQETIRRSKKRPHCEASSDS